MEICWNLTHCCPFSCKICMVNPVTVNENNKIEVQARLQKAGRALTLEDKIKIVEDIASSFSEVKIDFAGGDPLLFEENLEVIKLASAYFGQENVEISTTGYCISEEMLNYLKDKVSRLDFTLDTIFPRLENSRGDEYSKINMEAIALAARKEVPVTVSTVLKGDTIDEENLNSLYKFMSKNNVGSWFLLRYRPLGRGSYHKENEPSEAEYKKALEYGLSLEHENGPEVGIHHTFYSLMGIMNKEKSCKIGKKLTILSDGAVLSCCWAFNQRGQPLDDIFTLGKLPQDNLGELSKSYKLNDIRKFPVCRVDYFAQGKNQPTC